MGGACFHGCKPCTNVYVQQTGSEHPAPETPEPKALLGFRVLGFGFRV